MPRYTLTDLADTVGFHTTLTGATLVARGDDWEDGENEFDVMFLDDPQSTDLCDLCDRKAVYEFVSRQPGCSVQYCQRCAVETVNFEMSDNDGYMDIDIDKPTQANLTLRTMG